VLERVPARALARLVLLPRDDPQFRRNRERVNRDAERELISLEWDLGPRRRADGGRSVAATTEIWLRVGPSNGSPAVENGQEGTTKSTAVRGPVDDERFSTAS
jgi:hypothetical protein